MRLIAKFLKLIAGLASSMDASRSSQDLVTLGALGTLSEFTREEVKRSEATICDFCFYEDDKGG